LRRPTPATDAGGKFSRQPALQSGIKPHRSFSFAHDLRGAVFFGRMAAHFYGMQSASPDVG
jgi:hypothetical protein